MPVIDALDAVRPATQAAMSGIARHERATRAVESGGVARSRRAAPDTPLRGAASSASVPPGPLSSSVLKLFLCDLPPILCPRQVLRSHSIGTAADSSAAGCRGVTSDSAYFIRQRSSI